MTAYIALALHRSRQFLLTEEKDQVVRRWEEPGFFCSQSALNSNLINSFSGAFISFPTKHSRNKDWQLYVYLFEGYKHCKRNNIPPVATGEAGPPPRCGHHSILPRSLSTEGNGSLGLLGQAHSAVNKRQDKRSRSLGLHKSVLN